MASAEPTHAAVLRSVAEHYGTPCYVYDAQRLRANARAYIDTLGSRGAMFYAVKANSNLSVLQLLSDLGCGFDIVSGGELERLLCVGADPARIVFSGVGKTREEMRSALQAQIACFNIESEAELAQLAEVASEMHQRAPIALRINPDISVDTHPYIATGLADSKFGIPIAEAAELYRRAAASEHLRITGMSCHIGSQIANLEPLKHSLQYLLELRSQLADEGIAMEHIDMGGGLAVAEAGAAEPPSIANYINYLLKQFPADEPLALWLEPGRSISADAGVLLSRVQLLKTNGERNFAVLDAAMNDLIRPALYNAAHPVQRLTGSGGAQCLWQIVGPVCESADVLAENVDLALNSGDLIALGGAGAYGFSMSSNYNSRARCAEVMVDGESHRLIRSRETFEDMIAAELAALESNRASTV